jgi:hypothetical protein
MKKLSKSEKIGDFQRKFGITLSALGFLSFVTSILGIKRAVSVFNPSFAGLGLQEKSIAINIELFKLNFFTTLFSNLFIISIVLVLMGILFYTMGRKK